jgi:hypothetical protein
MSKDEHTYTGICYKALLAGFRVQKRLTASEMYVYE